MKPLQLVLLAPESWRPIEPSAGRSSNRTSERELDRIPARIRLGSTETAARLWDYSPFGFSILVQHIPPSAGIHLGQPATLALEIGGRNADFQCRVENISQFLGQIRLGLSRIDIETAPPESQPGLSVGDSLIVWGETRNPLLYGEWCSMRLEAVRPGMRMVFTSSDPTLVSYLGQEMDVELGVPTSGDAVYRGRTISLARLPGERVILVLEPIRISARLAAELAELLAMESGASPSDLKALGFPVSFLRDRLHFRHAEGEDDYSRVAALRKLSGEETNRGGLDTRRMPLPSRPGPDMRLLCAFHEDTLVAAILLGFPKTGKSFLGHLAIAADARPAMEIMDLSTHPDYRRGDLWLSIVERTCRIFLLSGCSLLRRTCDNRLLPLYRKMGFRESARDGGDTETPARLLILDRSTVFHGRGIGLSAWATLYGNLIEDFLDKGILEPKAWEKLRLRIMLKFKGWFQSRAAAKAERIFQACIRK